jgi:tetratricopeptide (TPR) repeat protein
MMRALLLVSLAFLAIACASAPEAVRRDGPSEASSAPSGAFERGEDAIADLRALVDEGRLVEARSAIANALRDDDEDAELLYLAAVVDARTGRVDEAVARARLAWERSEDAPYIRALDLMTRLEIAQGRAPRAVDYLERASVEDPDDLALRNLLVWALIEAGQVDEAVRGAREVLERSETNVGAMLNLARAYLRSDKAEHARYVLLRATELEPDEPEVLLLLGRLAFEDGDVRSAIARVERCVEAHPDFPEGHTVLGALYERVGDHAGAREHLDRAVQMAPGLAGAWLNLGNARRGLGEYGDAELAYEEALRIDADLADARYNLGILFLENDVDGYRTEERLERAIEELETFLGMAEEASDRERAERFIAEAKKRIEIAEQLRESELKAAESPEEVAPSDDSTEDPEEESSAPEEDDGG